MVGIEGKKNQTNENSLFFLKANVRRGIWATSSCRPPKLWCLLFNASKHWHAKFRLFQEPDPMSTIWELSIRQVTEFKAIFVKIMQEETSNHTGKSVASSALLLLLLTEIERWAYPQPQSPSRPENIPADVLRLWEHIHEAALCPGELGNPLQQISNYNSLRHRFKKLFGKSPQKMLQSLRIRHAKHLLLLRDSTVKEVAGHLGYGRQHEFSRAFHREVGVSPTEWKLNPDLKHGPDSPVEGRLE